VTAVTVVISPPWTALITGEENILLMADLHQTSPKAEGRPASTAQGSWPLRPGGRRKKPRSTYSCVRTAAWTSP